MCIRDSFNPKGYARWSFVEFGDRSGPGESPVPIHTHFVVRIDDVFCAKLMTKYFAVVLVNPENEALRLVGPVCVPYPKFVTARARHFEVLIDLPRGFVRTRGDGIP